MGMWRGPQTKLEGMHSPFDVGKPKLRVNSKASKSIGVQTGFAVTMLSPRGFFDRIVFGGAPWGD